MVSRNTKGGLITFVKSECANWYNSEKCCTGIDGDKCFNDHGPCLVAEGKPCGYFERAVLGPAEYKHRLPGYDYEQLFEQYAAINPAYLTKRVAVRHCGCGATLKPRHRYCDDCTRRKRQETYRLSRRKRAG